jgi:hypothetical protein
MLPVVNKPLPGDQGELRLHPEALPWTSRTKLATLRQTASQVRPERLPRETDAPRRDGLARDSVLRARTLSYLRIACTLPAAVATLATDLPGPALVGWESHPPGTAHRHCVCQSCWGRDLGGVLVRRPRFLHSVVALRAQCQGSLHDGCHRTLWTCRTRKKPRFLHVQSRKGPGAQPWHFKHLEHTERKRISPGLGHFNLSVVRSREKPRDFGLMPTNTQPRRRWSRNATAYSHAWEAPAGTREVGDGGSRRARRTSPVRRNVHIPAKPPQTMAIHEKYLSGGLGIRHPEPGQVLLDGGVQIDLAGFSELHHRQGGDRFRERP